MLHLVNIPAFFYNNLKNPFHQKNQTTRTPNFLTQLTGTSNVKQIPKKERLLCRQGSWRSDAWQKQHLGH